MIPTSYRAKLPKGFSYPVGAGMVSDALAASPHVEELSITFRDNQGFSSKFRRLLTERSPYTLMTARYKPACKPGLSAAGFMIERGWYDEKWELIVYAVLSEFRHLAEGLIRDVALPSVKAWLMSSGRAGWDAIWREIAFVFDPIASSLSARTSQGV